MTSRPFGPAWSVFRFGRCFIAVQVLVWVIFICPSGIVAHRHAFNCAKTLTCQNIDHTKTLTALKHRLLQSIDCAKALTVQKHQPHQNIEHIKTSTTLNHWPCQHITHAEIDWSMGQLVIAMLTIKSKTIYVAV